MAKAKPNKNVSWLVWGPVLVMVGMNIAGAGISWWLVFSPVLVSGSVVLLIFLYMVILKIINIPLD